MTEKNTYIKKVIPANFNMEKVILRGKKKYLGVKFPLWEFKKVVKMLFRDKKRDVPKGTSLIKSIQIENYSAFPLEPSTFTIL